ILQTAGDEAPSLVEAETRLHEGGSRVVEREQLLLVRREPEEPVPLLDPLCGDEMDRAVAVHQLGLALELLAADAVPAGIDVLVDVVAAVLADPAEEVLDERLVTVIGRPQEEVVRGAELLRQLPPDDGDPVRVLLRLEPLLRGG